MAVFRAKSAALVDAIVNHPDVRDGLRQSAADFVADKRNHVYANETGVFAAEYVQPGVYAVHVGVLAHGRGKAALLAAKEALDRLFASLDASMVIAQVPLRLRAARLFCRLLGFRHTGQDEQHEFFAYRR
jgi:hypothetical protein